MTIVVTNTIISIIYYISTLNTIITNINKIIITLLIIITYYIVDSRITGIITICTVIIINTKDIRNIYLWLEAYTLSTYILLYWKQNKQIRKEGIKYYIIGGISSSIILLGIYLIYRERGITTYPGISGIGGTIMTIGLILKLGTYPFTNWIIKIYPLYKKEIYNAIILIPQIGIIYTIDRNIIENIRTIKYVIIITIIYGMILGLKYKTYKKILISSSIMNTGIILILSITGSKLLITYIIIYVITTTQITTTLSKNTSKTNIIISIISIIGIPPLLGWYGKASIIRELITKEKIYVSLIIISTIISTIYYLIIIAPYIYEKTTTTKDKETISIIKTVYSVLITTTYIIIGYIWPYLSII